MADNMRFYNMARTVPDDALKPIQAGRLKGMSDINPMYRIKRLTEMFGPCGIGWWYVEKNKEIVFDEITNQKSAFYDIDLYYRDPETGEISQPVPGTGGASFVANERNGAYMSDECFKMALTDAISVAAKAIGVAADVYYAKDRTKYSSNTEPSGSAESAKAAGQKRLEELKAQNAALDATMAAAKKNALSIGKPATTEQKVYIQQNAPDDLLMKSVAKYGSNFADMTEAEADKIINYIKKNGGPK